MIDKVVEIVDIVKRYNDVKALDNVSLTVDKGETISIIGPSGSGKSTLLRSINQLEIADSGKIIIEGTTIFDKDVHGHLRKLPKKDVLESHKKVGMVFQHFNLFPHKTVLENVIEAPIVVNKMKKSAAVEMGMKLLSSVGLADKRDAFPSQISGGQKQRVAIARALGMQPDILLCDEPTSALDPELIGEVLTVLSDLSQSMTMMIVTHEMSFAREISDRIIFMDQGQILEQGPPKQIFETPDHARIKTFLEKMI